MSLFSKEWAYCLRYERPTPSHYYHAEFWFEWLACMHAHFAISMLRNVPPPVLYVACKSYISMHRADFHLSVNLNKIWQKFMEPFISFFLLSSFSLFIFIEFYFVCFWGCIFRVPLTWAPSSVWHGCAAHASWHRRLATCIWPRSSVWTPTGLQNQPPPLKPNPALKTAPPINSWSIPSTPPAPRI